MKKHTLFLYLHKKIQQCPTATLILKTYSLERKFAVMWFGYFIRLPFILVVWCGSFLDFELNNRCVLTGNNRARYVERGRIINVPNDCLFFTKLPCYCGDSILGKLGKSGMPAITWSSTFPTHSHGLGRLVFREPSKVRTAPKSLTSKYPEL